MLRIFSLPVVIAALALLSASAQAVEEVLFDAALGAPAGQGWGRAAEESSTLEGLIEGDPPAWKIGGHTSSVNRILYTHSLPEAPLVQEVWSVEAAVRVVSASAAVPRDAVLEVLDGVSQWSLCLVRINGHESIGYINAEGVYQALGEAPLADDFGVLKATYDPGASSLALSFNGHPLGVLTRNDVPPTAHSNQRRVAWGDNNASAPADAARSEAYWQKVRFTLGE